MAKVITLSRSFPAYHPKAGQHTYFVEQVLNAMGIEYWESRYLDLLINLNAKNISEGKLTHDDLFFFQRSLDPLSSGEKIHTIRAGHRWKTGDKASLRVWSGKPYNSPQIIIVPDVEIVKVYDFETWEDQYVVSIDTDEKPNSFLSELASNDGLSVPDLVSWFKLPCHFKGQVLCWKEVYYV